MHAHFWNWFFLRFAVQAPPLPNLGHFSAQDPTCFVLHPAGRFRTILQQALIQKQPPPLRVNRWGGPRNPSSVLRWFAYISAGGSLKDATPFQRWTHAYQSYAAIPVLDAVKAVHESILFLGDSLIVQHKAQLSSHITATIRFDSSYTTKTHPALVRSFQLTGSPAHWRIEIQCRFDSLKESNNCTRNPLR